VPVIESYPSIVGIAQVSQAAGQGRYNKWLAEYNSRSNQASTNAALSGFQAGSSLGMSVQNMWQQQQQFAQRQGFIESQAAQTLQKDTERASAMIPALDPYVKQLYPHLNEEQRGAYIGSLDGRQLDAMTNNLGNASRAKAAYDQFGSPQAIRQQAKATYDKLVTGHQFKNKALNDRLQPIFDRMRSNDLGLTEEAVQTEIAKILRETGEAKEGRSKQEQADLNTFEVRDDDGNLLEKVIEMQPGKYIQVKNPRAATTGTRTRGSQGGGTMEDLADRNKVWGYVDNEHKRMLQEWEQNNTSGYDARLDEDQIGTIERDGTYYRPITPNELKDAEKSRVLPEGTRSHEGQFLVPVRIPPRPTFEDAKQSILRRYPGSAEFLGAGAQSATGPGVTRLKFPPPPDHITALRDQMAGQAAQAGGGQPGQVMPQVPQVRRPDLIPARGPSAGGMADYGAAGFEERGRVRPGEALLQPDIDAARSTALRDENAKEKSEGIAIRKLRKDHGDAGQVALRTLIGVEGLPPTQTTAKFEQYIRQGGDPSAFDKDLLVDEEMKAMEKAIPGLEGDAGPIRYYPSDHEGVGEVGTERRFGRDDDPGISWRRRAKVKLIGRDKDVYFAIERSYRMKREFVSRLAAEAIRHTPPGQRPRLGNIPSYTMGQFDLAVQRGQMKVGTMIMTSAGAKPVTTQDLRAAQDRLYQRRVAPPMNQR